MVKYTFYYVALFECCRVENLYFKCRGGKLIILNKNVTQVKYRSSITTKVQYVSKWASLLEENRQLN